ncbi:M20 family metallo-hydrolase [Primorskyibacter marinus]|uniref:M20 family metallo-hydrolase n=1 Tax=Primorskyibacter marinus TaxID=1977320 RepID=UPI001E45A456|nr:M20 family metallo-hydrolase [Primorskyibacter marinus]
MTNWGRICAERLNALARVSEPGPGVTRLPFTPEHAAVLDLLRGWMAEAGLTHHLDDAGTLVGRHVGDGRKGTFYIGSHQDSVREGGAFDGIMGIVLAIAALQKLKDEGASPDCPVEVLAFADEEGVRWPTALVGSRAVAGTVDPAVLDMTDRDGVTLRAAMEEFGLAPERIGKIARDPATALGYLECHIEQGPVLEQADVPLGVVTAICGIERHVVTLTGETGHAGTLPMATRRDALVGAAALVAEVDRLAQETEGLRATVGELHVAPNVVNAVPRDVRLTVELRAPDDAMREEASRHLQDFAHRVTGNRGVDCDMQRSYRQPAQPCEPLLTNALARAVGISTGRTALRLPSGATHDASAMADLCPISMMFVRCRNGVSHTPDEHVSREDLEHAVEALSTFLAQMT